MDLKKKDLSQLQLDVLLGFHKQFAENQRAREGAFLKLLAFLGALLAAYAVVIQGTLVPTGRSIHPREVQLFQILAATLLFAGTWVVVVFANNFRRDQYVNVRIRRACGLMGHSEIFPMTYDPQESLRKWGLWLWIPDFFLVFYWLFLTLQASLVGIFGIVLWPRLPVDVLTTGSTISLVYSGILLLVSLSVLPLTYRHKLLVVMDVKSEKYGIWAASKRRFRRKE